MNEPEEDLKLVYGKITKMFDSSFNLSVNGGNAINYRIDNNVKFYSVDSSMSKNNIKTAEFTELSVFDEDDNNRVFIKLIDDTVKEVVIVR